MQVEAAEPRRLQHLAGQDLAECDDNGRVEIERPEGHDLFGIAHRQRQADRQGQFNRQSLDRRGPHDLAPAARFLRLGLDAGDLVAGARQGGQAVGGDLRGPQERDTHKRSLASRAGMRNPPRFWEPVMKPVIAALILCLPLMACDDADRQKAADVAADVKESAGDLVKEAGETAKEGAEVVKKDGGGLVHETGVAIKESAQNVREKTGPALQKTGQVIKSGAVKVGDGANKVGSNIKDAVTGDNKEEPAK